jgi:hypothetical protein
VAEAARDLGVRHVPDVARNEWGTPRIDDVFAKAEELASNRFLCYSNADIIMTNDIVRAVELAAARWPRFLLSGQRTNLDVTEPLDFGSGWEARLAQRAKREGALYTAFGMDYFAFPRGLWSSIPPFAVGRVCWDNWMIYAAKASGAAVIDATPRVTAIHQNHTYAHIVQDPRKDWAWSGPEAESNRALAGGWAFIFSLADANWTMRGDRLIPALAPRNLRRRLIGPLAVLRARLRPRTRLLAILRAITGAPRPSSPDSST